MTDRWGYAATRLQQIEPPGDLWDRIAEGPRLPAPGPGPRTRVTAILTAFAVFAVAVALLWLALAPRHEVVPLGGSNIVDVPPRGEVAPVFLADGRPVFVVHHPDGGVTVVDAFSSHRAWGVEELNVWCPSTREFVERAHDARFDEYGHYASAGPAPTGLETFSFDPVALGPDGDPTRIRVGEMRAASPQGSAPEVDPSTYPPFCDGASENDLVHHTIPDNAIYGSPATAVEAAPTGWIAVRGTLLVARDGFVQLCAEVVGDDCRGGAVVRGIDGVGLMLNVTRSPDVTAYEEPQLWIARVNGGVLDDIAGLLGIQD
jgi:hypothetical protein